MFGLQLTVVEKVPRARKASGKHTPVEAEGQPEASGSTRKLWAAAQKPSVIEVPSSAEDGEPGESLEGYGPFNA